MLWAISATKVLAFGDLEMIETTTELKHDFEELRARAG
jgi:hypothetical protein